MSKYTASLSVTIPPFPIRPDARALKGTESLSWGYEDDVLALRFTYHKHSVEMIPDNDVAEVTYPSGEMEGIEYPRRTKSWASRISFVKRYIASKVADARKERDQQYAREVMDKVERVWSATIPTWSYKGYEIEVHQDDHGTTCPWDDWDGEPNALEYGNHRWRHAYGKSELGPFDSPVASDDWSSIDVVLRQLGLFHGAVAMEFFTQNNYIAYFTREDIDEHFAGDEDLAFEALRGSISVFKEWANYGPHGFVLKRNGEVIESLWDIYSGDPYADPHYAIGEAIAIADIDIAERDELEEEVREEKRAELGYA